MRPAIALLVLSLSLPAVAAPIVVDCTGSTPGAFTTITAALNSLGTTPGPATLDVSGTCNENIFIQYRDALTIEGTPSAGIHANSGPVVNVTHTRGLVLRRLTISGGGIALYVRNQSEATLDDVTLRNSGSGLIADTQSIVTAGGVNPVSIHDTNYGVLLDGASFTANGNVTIENNNIGVDAEASRVAFLGKPNANSPVGPNYIRNNAFNGVFAHGGTTLDFRGQNGVNGNGLNGVLAFQNSNVEAFGTTGFTTTFDGNHRSAIGYIFNSSGQLVNVVITNNGSATEPLSSGVTSSVLSSLIVTGSTISGTTGPGVAVDTGGMARFRDTTVSGNSADPFHLATGGILELQDGNTVSGTTPFVACDDSAILFGSGAGTVSTTCKKTK